LGLRLWQGRYEEHENTWLRWVDSEGQLIPSGNERAESERQRAELARRQAELARQQAESERQRADRLAEQLRQLGIEPQGS
jgi:hypothetical protein